MLLYHYCSTKKFKEILSSKVLWLSDLKKSNDREEVIRTFEILWNKVKNRLIQSDLDKKILIPEINIIDKQFKIEVVVDPPFGCCFCQDGDILQQWIEYGDRTKGVSLGFDFDWFNNIPSNTPHPNVSLEKSIGYSNVIYHHEAHENTFYEICYNAMKTIGHGAWIRGIRPTFKHYSAFIKNPTFFGEYESRIVYYPFKEHDYTNNALGLTGPIESPFMHYCLPWARGSDDIALSKIILGCNCNITKSKVKKLLIKCDLNDNLEIAESFCPYIIRK